MKLKYKQTDVQFKRFKSQPEKLRFPESQETIDDVKVGFRERDETIKERSLNMALTPTQVKEKFKNDGITFSGWARTNGYRPQEVIRVLNGFSKASYGKGHEIAKKLGLK